MPGKYLLTEENRNKAITMVKAGRTAREIADLMGVQPRVIRHMAAKLDLKCRMERRLSNHKESEQNGRWVNLIARNSGLPNNLV